ncbi:hypothetical protein J3F83DRAFT_743781 [Trichoderma novae-zelandiae]
MYSVPWYKSPLKPPVLARLQTGPDTQTNTDGDIRPTGYWPNGYYITSYAATSMDYSQQSQTNEPQSLEPHSPYIPSRYGYQVAKRNRNGRSRRLSEPRGPALDLASTHGHNDNRSRFLQLRKNTDKLPCSLFVSVCVRFANRRVSK